MENKEFDSSNSDQSNTPKKRNYTWIYIGIISVLIITNLFLFFQKKESTEKAGQIMGQVSNLITEREAIQQEYDASLARLDLLTSENVELNKQLSAKAADIEKQKSRINQILRNKKATDAELKEARQLISQLNKTITSYEEEIASLKEDNQMLRTTIDSITVEQDDLKNKIEEAKVLAIGNIKLTAISLRRKGKVERETQRARRADLLRVSFDIVQNRLIDNSEETIYIAISNPDGYMLSNAALGSGSFINHNEETIYYSMFNDFNIQKGKKIKDIVIDWVQSSDYEKGEYDVKVYHKKQLIGESKVLLR